MAKITYIKFDGSAQVVAVAPGLSVMEGAVKNNVQGIDAECGGSMACGTCQVYVDPAWLDKVNAKSDMEAQMLECVLDARDNSRLACQITVTEQLDGLIVRIPRSQR
jgi:2Fe-2S ferredoxin